MDAGGAEVGSGEAEPRLIQMSAAGEELGRGGELRRAGGGGGDDGDARPPAAARRASIGVGDVVRRSVSGAGRDGAEVDHRARRQVAGICAIAAAAGRGCGDHGSVVRVPATGVGGGDGELGEAAGEPWDSDSDDEDGARSFSLDPYADEFVPETEPQELEAMAMLSRPAGQSGGGDGVFAPNSGIEEGKFSGVVSADAETEDENETEDTDDPSPTQDLYWNDFELNVLRDCIPGFKGKPLKLVATLDKST
ncbi:hypothetical protein EJB05_43074, partial [Eragrostis curvula]